MNLLGLFKEQLTEGVLAKVSGLIGGEDSSAIQKGLMTAAPALLGGIMDKASTTEGATSIFNMLGDGSELSNLNADGNEPSDGFLSKGQDLVNTVLGDKASGVIDMVSSMSGIGKESSSSLLSTAGSMLSGVLGEQKASGLDLGSFVGMLSNQGSFLDKFAPAGLASLLGLASFSGISGKLGDLAGGALGFAGNIGKAGLDGANKVIGGATELVGDAGKAALDGAGKITGAAAGAVGSVAGFAGKTGKAALGGVGKAASAATGTVGNAGKAVVGGAGKVAGAAVGAASGAVNAGGSLIKKILPWAIGLLALLFAFFLIKGCDSDKSMLDNVTDAASQTTGSITDAAGNATDAAGNVIDSTVDAAGNAVDAAGNAVNSTVDAAGNAISDAADASGNMVNAFGQKIGSFFESALPNGTKLNIPQGGFEDKLLSYVKDGKFEAGSFYVFDRLYFNTGSSSLSDESVEQIKNVAAILSAYPEVKVLFRGHTDNTGSADGNNKLSANRALAVKNKLAEKGVDASRIATKGMGSSVAIATNDTPEGRANNRRIDVSIVK